MDYAFCNIQALIHTTDVHIYRELVKGFEQDTFWKGYVGGWGGGVYFRDVFVAELVFRRGAFLVVTLGSCYREVAVIERWFVSAG